MLRQSKRRAVGSARWAGRRLAFIACLALVAGCRKAVPDAAATEQAKKASEPPASPAPPSVSAAVAAPTPPPPDPSQAGTCPKVENEAVGLIASPLRAAVGA